MTGLRLCNCSSFRSIYVDRNSSSASLYLTRSGYSHKLVTVIYLSQQLNHLSPAAAVDDDDDDGGYSVAGVRVYPAIEGVDFSRAVSTVALSADVVSVVKCLQLFDISLSQSSLSSSSLSLSSAMFSIFASL